MNFRATALTGAALAAILMIGAPASAQRSPYDTNPTPAERAQTNALNTDAASNARGNADANANTNAANQADYDRARADYDNKMDNYDAQRAAYNRDRSRYLNDRAGYAHRWDAFYGYSRFQDVSRLSETRLMGLQVSTRGGNFIGRVRDVDTNSYGRVTRVAVSTSRDRTAWIDADDLRYDPSTRMVMTDLSQGQINDMARMRYPRF
jgi:sporulation protein YlmC with PRC-barrel domain